VCALFGLLHNERFFLSILRSLVELFLSDRLPHKFFSGSFQAAAPGSWAVARRMTGAAVVDDETTDSHRDDEETHLQPSCDEEISDQHVEKSVVTAPIDSPSAQQERVRFSRDFFRSLLVPSAATTSPSDNNDMDDRIRQSAALAHGENVQAERRVLEEPDLRVPVGDAYLHLAQ
jgi:hypothetical protein